MEVNNSLEGLKSLLGTASASQTASQPAGNAKTGDSALGSDQATLSSWASEVSLTAGDSQVRADKVAGIQATLAAGTYNVPASAVASRLVDAMLGAG